MKNAVNTAFHAEKGTDEVFEKKLISAGTLMMDINNNIACGPRNMSNSSTFLK